MADKPRYRGRINPETGRTEYVYVQPSGSSSSSTSGGSSGGSSGSGSGSSDYGTGTSRMQGSPRTGSSLPPRIRTAESIGRGTRTANRFVDTMRGSQYRQVPVRPGIPRILGSSRIIKFAWLGSMVVVGWEAIHDYGVLPPPGRLFWISGIYMLLGAMGTINSLLPLMNALALGFLVTLVYQYYSRSQAA